MIHSAMFRNLVPALLAVLASFRLLADCSAPPPAGLGAPPATLDALQAADTRCALPQARTLRWTDRDGTARFACLYVPPGLVRGEAYPLLVWLHASLVGPETVAQTGLVAAARQASLSASPARPGFILLAPAGRSISHHYPPPDDRGLGWDNWYRNLDRASPALNVDVATIDQFIAQARALAPVDAKRVYLSGWSNGAAMAQLYALNTLGVAAAAVYASPDPFRDVAAPCAQAPFASRLAPLLNVHNRCELLGFCQSGERYAAALTARLPGLLQRRLVIDGLQREVTSCDATCAGQTAYTMPAVLLHGRWPRQRNEDLFAFLRAHPLP